jgi:hypothetical protein
MVSTCAEQSQHIASSIDVTNKASENCDSQISTFSHDNLCVKLRCLFEELGLKR